MAIQPRPPDQPRGGALSDTAELRLRSARRRPVLPILAALIAVCGLAVAVIGIRTQFKPRTFTPAQQRKIETWEVAKRWRTTPKKDLFPARVSYRLAGSVSSGSSGKGLLLNASRAAIAPEDSCRAGAGGSRALMGRLAGEGCEALLRSTYVDSTGSLVLTAGIAVLKSQASAVATARFLTGGPGTGQGGAAKLVLRPYAVKGTPAAGYRYPQRQFSWVVAAGPYLVMATVAYADGRPRVPVMTDPYLVQEMTTFARAVAVKVAAPLSANPPVPRCPGVPSC
ncbi:MAG: hypothetical protein ACR2FU_25045 [Streptosporangiaceae bacterium]